MTTLQQMLARRRAAAERSRQQNEENTSSRRNVRTTPESTKKSATFDRAAGAKRQTTSIINQQRSVQKVSGGIHANPNVFKVEGQHRGARLVDSGGRTMSRRVSPQTLVTAVRSGLLHPLIPDLEEYEYDVSVIFGTYNRREHLENCVGSIRRACPNVSYEIVVSDGGSTDGSREWMDAQPDITCLRGDLSGAVRAFNACFAASSGRVILTLNDDAELDEMAVHNGLRHFEDPMVGQVAFAFSVGNRAFEILTVHDGIYVNYGMIRANVAKAIAGICGGLWAPVYYTYGGDTELSMWVRRLGYMVTPAPTAKVLDRHAQDELRRRSHETERGKSGKIFGTRWPDSNYLRFRGPLPPVSRTESIKLQHIEVGETPSVRWGRLAQVDPKPGEFPLRTAPRPERVLHVHLRTDEDPQESLSASLRALGTHGYAMVDWMNLSPAQRDEQVLEAAKISPTLVFMQLQGPGVVSNQVIQTIRQYKQRDPSMVVAAWCGDVGRTNGPWAGFDDAWSHALSKQVDVMLYTGTGQVQMQRARGMKNAAYLQIGFDVNRYHPGGGGHGGSDLVFLGQNYGAQWNGIPGNDAQVRRDMVAAFKRGFKFRVYGGGWHTGPVNQANAAGVYRSSRIALSVSLTSQLGRYTSDRMIRSMACGTATLVKRFADMEGLGLEHGKNVLVWDNVAQAVEIARDWLRPDRSAELSGLGHAGAQLMQKHHTWGVRMQELSVILKALRGQR